jgi:hypothetical protein
LEALDRNKPRHVGEMFSQLRSDSQVFGSPGFFRDDLENDSDHGESPAGKKLN